MGSTVQAWLGSADGLCTHFLAGPLERFEVWAREAATEWPHLPRGEVLELIGQIRTTGRAALDARDPAAAHAVDDLIQSYYGDFASLRGRHCIPAVEDVLPERLYRAGLDALVASRAPDLALSSWRFILDGRPPVRDPVALPFAPTKGALRVAFWTLAECKALRPILEQRVRTTAAGEAKDAFSAAARATSRAASEAGGLIFATG